MSDTGYKRNRFAKAGWDERKINVLPIPCTKVQEKTVKDWFQKINEELDELKIEIMENFSFDSDLKREGFDNDINDYDDIWDSHHIVEEAMDTITAITSMLEAMGIDEKMRQEAQKRVNERNRERGRLG